MKFSILISIFIFYFVCISSSNNLDDCKKFWKEKFTHPYECCDYPFLVDTNETLKCYEKCESANIKECCGLGCFNNVLEIIVNGKLVKKNLIDRFLRTINGNQENWRQVVERSYDKCFADVEAFGDWSDAIPALNGTCNTEISVYYLEQCIMENNFLNCPLFSNETECGEVKNYVRNGKECSITFGNYTFLNQLFWYVWTD